MPAQPDLNLQPPRPAWGVALPMRKSRSTAQSITLAPPPRLVIVALDLYGGPTRLLVAVGDRVQTGQPLAESALLPGLKLPSPLTGRVGEIANRAVAGPDAAAQRCIVIEADGPESRWSGLAADDPDQLESGELLARIAGAGIVGLGGALFPAAAKLASARGATLLIINGVECEPYISCDEMLLRERAADVIAGARIMLRAAGIARGVIVIKNSMTAARIALRDALEAAADACLALAQVTARYPAGGERQLIEMLTGREVPASGLPADVGCICQNVATAAAVARLFATGEPMISRVVTLTGGALGRPVNVEARLGTPLGELLPLAGGYACAPERLVMGGPMMGRVLASDDLPLTAATNCIIAAAPGELPPLPPELACIRCGNCMEVCPARLLPQELLVAGRRQDAAALAALGLEACIECGACDYVCPSGIPLTAGFVAAKARLMTEQQRGQRALHVRSRVEARAARLAAASLERAQALDAHARSLAAADAGAGADALAALLGGRPPDPPR